MNNETPTTNIIPYIVFTILYLLVAIIIASTSNPNNNAWRGGKTKLQDDSPTQILVMLCAIIWPITLFFYWVLVAQQDTDNQES